jgi:hypothetical protein
MKRLLLVVLFILASSSLWAVDHVWLSSYTATAEATQNLCVNRHGMFHGVVVSSASDTSGGQIAIYASSGTVDSTMTIVDTAAKGFYVFDAAAISTNTVGSYKHTGLTYSKVGTASVSILYSCY